MASGVRYRYEGAKTVYTTCRCNCGGNEHCVLKALVKDGKVVAVEPDDRYSPNAGREDSGLPEQDLIKNRLQRRPCVMGLAFHKYLFLWCAKTSSANRERFLDPNLFRGDGNIGVLAAAGSAASDCTGKNPFHVSPYRPIVAARKW